MTRNNENAIDGNDQSRAELVISTERIKSVVTDLLGYNIDDDGYILDEEDKRIESTEGKPIPVSEIGYLGSGPNGELEPVPDNFASVVRYHSDRDLQKENEKRRINQ